MATKAKTKRAKKGSSVYIRVAHHIYSTGDSYRVRAIVNGKKISAYFTSKRKAIQYRNSILAD